MFTLSVHALRKCPAIPKTKALYTASRTKEKYAVMMKTVRKEFPQLKTKDKYLYEILIDYDYADEMTGLCKGYVFPDPKKTLTNECNTSYRTICRQLERLEQAKLIKRIPRQNKGPIIILLDIPEEQLSTYRNERRMPKTAIAYNRNNETKRNKYTNNTQCTAVEQVVVRKLVLLGYGSGQALTDVKRYGADEVDYHITNLCLTLKKGAKIRDLPRWLNWAIRTKYCIDTSQLPSFPSADRAPTRVPPIEETHELVDDGSGNLMYIFKRQPEEENGLLGLLPKGIKPDAEAFGRAGPAEMEAVTGGASMPVVRPWKKAQIGRISFYTGNKENSTNMLPRKCDIIVPLISDNRYVYS
jgi:hypothetical protein